MTNRLMSEMVRNQWPITLHPDAIVAEAFRHMDESRVGEVLVIDVNDHLVGIFTGRDAVRMLVQQRTANSRLEAVMTWSPDVIPRGHTATDVLRLMQDGGFRNSFVVDRGHLVGVTS